MSKKKVEELQEKLKRTCERLDEYIQANGSSEKLKQKSRKLAERAKKLAKQKND